MPSMQVPSRSRRMSTWAKVLAGTSVLFLVIAYQCLRQLNDSSWDDFFQYENPVRCLLLASAVFGFTSVIMPRQGRRHRISIFAILLLSCVLFYTGRKYPRQTGTDYVVTWRRDGPKDGVEVHVVDEKGQGINGIAVKAYNLSGGDRGDTNDAGKVVLRPESGIEALIVANRFVVVRPIVSLRPDGLRFRVVVSDRQAFQNPK